MSKQRRHGNQTGARGRFPCSHPTPLASESRHAITTFSTIRTRRNWEDSYIEMKDHKMHSKALLSIAFMLVEPPCDLQPCRNTLGVHKNFIMCKWSMYALKYRKHEALCGVGWRKGIQRGDVSGFKHSLPEFRQKLGFKLSSCMADALKSLAQVKLFQNSSRAYSPLHRRRQC